MPTCEKCNVFGQYSVTILLMAASFCTFIVLILPNRLRLPYSPEEKLTGKKDLSLEDIVNLLMLFIEVTTNNMFVNRYEW